MAAATQTRSVVRLRDNQVMTARSAELAIIESDDGVLLLGDEKQILAFERQAGLPRKRASSRVLAQAGAAFGTVGELQGQSGRWLKLTQESAEHLSKFGGSLSKNDRLLTGVVRGDAGRIAKHLKFENLGLLTPAAPAAAAAMMTQLAVESALADIQEYLAVIDAKLDQLLQQRKTEKIGRLGGISAEIDEAYAIFESTGTVSSVTWSKVQGNSTDLKSLQFEAVESLRSIASRVSEVAGNTDKSADLLEDVGEDVEFWLGVLARTVALQDRQYILELAHIAAVEPDHLEPHRAAIITARAARLERVRGEVESVSSSVDEAAQLSNRARVANPFNARHVVERANRVQETVAAFAKHADFELVAIEQLQPKPWRRAAKALVGETAEQVGSFGEDVGQRARSLGVGIHDRGGRIVRGLSGRIEQRRSRRDSAASDDEAPESDKG